MMPFIFHYYTAKQPSNPPEPQKNSTTQVNDDDLYETISALAELPSEISPEAVMIDDKNLLSHNNPAYRNIQQ